jgi:hypothetical protein
VTHFFKCCDDGNSFLNVEKEGAPVLASAAEAGTPRRVLQRASLRRHKPAHRLRRGAQDMPHWQ